MNRNTKGILLSLSAGTLWGSMGLFVNYFQGLGLQAMQIVSMRIWFGALALCILLLLYNKKLFRIRVRDIWVFAGSGIISITFFSWCYFYTISVSSMAQAATLLYLAPSLVMLMSAVIFKEKITGRKVVAVGIAFIGCVLVTGMLGSGVVMKPVVILTGLGSAIGYALYSVFSRVALSKGYHSLSVILYTFVFASPACFFLTDASEIGQVIFSGSKPLGVFALMGIITTVVPYILYTASLLFIENSKASVAASIEPVIAAFLGLLLGQPLGWSAVTGIMLVLSAVILLNIKPKNRL